MKFRSAIGFVAIVCQLLLSTSSYGQPHVTEKEIINQTAKTDCPPENQGGDAGTNVSDPINLATGDFMEIRTDLYIPGRGLDFNLRRVYRSRNGLWSLYGPDDYINFQAPLGMNTDHAYNMRVEHQLNEIDFPQEQSSLVYFDGTGRADRFVVDNNYTLPTVLPGDVLELDNNEYFAVLEFRGVEEEILLIDSDKTTFRFHPLEDSSGNPTFQSGRLKSITDRVGNKIQVFHESVTSWSEDSNRPASRISHIIDTLDNQIDFYYHDEDPLLHSDPILPVGDADYRHLLWKVEDHAGRNVYYRFDFRDDGEEMDERRLIEVVLPEVVSDSHFSIPTEHARFNDDPASHGRRSWTYTWGDEVGEGAGPGVGHLKGQMEGVTSPNGDLITTNEYTYWSAFPSEQRLHLSRVSKQSYGGDFYYYTVTDKNGDRLNTLEALYDYYYVWVVNRRNNVVRFKYTTVPLVPTLTSSPNLQLVEMVEYPGIVPITAQGNHVWGEVDSTDGSVTQWKYYTGSATQSFASLVDQKRASDTPVVTNYVRNDNWRVTQVTLPNGDTVSSVYGTGSDPRGQNALTSRTISSADSSESITESWEYDFAFLEGGGCGCGTDGFDTAHIDGNGNVTIKEYEPGTFDIPPLPSNGNLKRILHDLPPGTDTSNYVDSNAMAIEEFDYNSHGQVIKHVNPQHTMWDEGNSVEVTQNRTDRYEYYTDSNDVGNYGRLRYRRIDTDGTFAQNLTTEYFYDKVGNVIKEIEPDGDIKKYLYNQHHELIRSQHYDSTETDLYAQIDYFYDANGNLVKTEELNLDDQLVPYSANSTLLTVHEYDVLDERTKTSRQIESFAGTLTENSDGSFDAPTDTNWVVQEWQYDENRNLIKFLDGEATRGNDATNVITYEYDFRNLLFSETRGSGTGSYRIEYDYDLNGRNTVQVANPTNSSEMQVLSKSYDAFDRVRQIVDPMDNEISYNYDDNHNLKNVSVCGASENDSDSTGDDHSLLFRADLFYDRHDRVEHKQVLVFDSVDTQPATCAGLLSTFDVRNTFYEYNNDSSIYSIDEPSADSQIPYNTTTYYYDTAGRFEFRFDNDGNSIQYTYDNDSNITRIDKTDASTTGATTQNFVTTFDYDSMDRLTEQVDGVQNDTLWTYDSRSNLLSEIDPRGNLKTYEYDSLNRMRFSRVRMTADGDGPVNDPLLAVNGEIETEYVYDDSSRVVSITDDNLNTTSYTYDGLNRRTSMTMPGGEIYSTIYNQNNQAQYLNDGRNVLLELVYDKNSRLIRREVDEFSSVTPVGSQLDLFEYDGLGRVTKATNYLDLSETLPLTQVTREYDSRGFVLRETQNADGAGSFPTTAKRVVDYTYDLSNNTTQILYPHGRDIRRTYDSMNRLISIKDHETSTPMDIVTNLEYVGRRLESRTNGNSTKASYAYNGYDALPPNPNDQGFGRVVGVTTTHTSSSAVLDDFGFTWDAAQNRVTYDDIGSGTKNRRERSFSYDSSDRLVSTDVDFPDVNTDYPAPTNGGVTDYELDGVHNRYTVSGFEGAGAPIGTYKDTSVDVLDHVENNQYTFSPRGAGEQWVYTYDGNGNMVIKAQYNPADFTGDYILNFQDVSAFNAAYANEDPDADINNDGTWNFLDISAFLAAYGAGDDIAHQHYTYDFRNQLIGIEYLLGADTTPSVKIENTYDPFARRLLESFIDNETPESKVMQFVYGCASLWEMIEQIQLADAEIPEKLLTSHVYGLGIDDEVAYRIEDLVTPENYWSHRDDLNSLTSVTDSLGSVKERYEYGDFGRPRIIDPATGDEIFMSSVSAVHLYTGRSLMTGVGLFDYRHRVLDPETGRFVQRDPLEYIDSLNMYTYVSSTPYSFVDPLGLNNTQSPYLPGGGNSDGSAIGSGLTGAGVAIEDPGVARDDYNSRVAAQPGDGSSAMRDKIKDEIYDEYGPVNRGLTDWEHKQEKSGRDHSGKNNPKKTNSDVNRICKKFKWGGRALGVVGIGLEIKDVVDADPDDRPKEIAKSTGGILGGAAGGMGVGAVGGSLFGPPGAVGGAIVGGVVGAIVGEEAVDSFIDSVENSSPNDGPSYPNYACFINSTLVETPSGSIPIQDVNVQDFVYTVNDVAESQGNYYVSNIIKSKAYMLVEISVDGELLLCTPEHPFYTLHGWVLARELSSRYRLLSKDGSWVKIDSVYIVELAQPVEVRTLTIEGAGAYRVGVGGYLVHNK